MNIFQSLSEDVHMPTSQTGTCLCCGKQELTRASWCFGCGAFMCTRHDHHIASGVGSTIPRHTQAQHAGAVAIPPGVVLKVFS